MKGDGPGKVKLTSMKEPPETTQGQEDAQLCELKRRVSLNTAIKLRVATLVVSWISVAILLILGFITLILAILDKNTSAFAFSLDALLDCLSSLVVIWRYYQADSLYNKKKEKRACIVLGVLFLVSFASVITQSAVTLSRGGKPKLADIIWYMAIVNAVVCLCLFTAKLYLARQLESISIATDAVNSGIGVLLAVATFVGDVVYENNPKIWYIDPVLGMVCSLFLLIYGVWIICYEVNHEVCNEDYEIMK